MGETGPYHTEKDKIQTMYPKDLENLNTMLKEKGITPGDMVLITDIDGITTGGYYAGSCDAINVIRFDKNKAQYEFDKKGGGLEIVITPHPHKIGHSRFEPTMSHADVLVRDVKLLEKLIPEKK
jgi:hypothetical protein